MKRTFLLLLPAALFVSSAAFVPTTFATVPPSLQLIPAGGGDNVQINITGDPNSSVLLSYNQLGSGTQIASLGSTDGNGSFTTTVSSASYGLISGTPVTAIIGGTGGPKSPAVAWPTVTSASSLSLSQNALVLSVGSSANVTATPQGSAALYVSNNSNSSIANVSISGTGITFSGNTAGTTSVTICQLGNTTNCPTVFVTVLQAGSGQLSMSQSSASVVSGQNLPITLSGGSGAYQVTNNTNSSVIQASISGSVLTLTTGATSGSSSITVCTSDLLMCGVIVAAAGNASSVAVSFSANAPIVSVGQSTNVNIYGPVGVQFYVSSNASPAVVQANLSGSTLTLSGIAPGTSSISVCATTSVCSTLGVTVQAALTGASIALSQNTVSILAGQNLNITISGGAQPYFVSGGSSAVAQTTISGNSLTVIGIASGTSTVNVCSSGGGCMMLVITVNGTGASSAASFSMNPSVVTLAVGQSSTVSLSGTGTYTVSGNTGPSVASANISGSSATISGLAAGLTNVTICESSGPCLTLPVTVGSSATQTPVTSVPQTTQTTTSVVGTAPAYTFTKYLASGSSGGEVTELQKLLAKQGVFTATPNGNFGPQTKAAVVKFQAAHGISQLGVVGPATRSALNELKGASVSNAGVAHTAIEDMTLSELQTKVQALQAELTKALSRIAQLTGQ